MSRCGTRARAGGWSVRTAGCRRAWDWPRWRRSCVIWALPRIGPWCWWMHRSTRARLADMHRLMAWPFLSWCFVHRHLAPDLELLGAKPGGCRLPAVWAAQDRDNVDAVAEAAAVLGWSKNWLRQVSLLAASTICLHTGKRVRQPSEDDFAGVLGQLDDLAVLPRHVG